MGSDTALAPIIINPATFLREHNTLPALPEVLSQIQSVLRDEDAAIQRVAELISSDPALLAQTLKIVNSAYYGLPWEVTKAQVAISFLGLNEIYRMVLSLSVINTLSIIGKKEELNTFWFHSIYTAITSKYLLTRYGGGVCADELWSAAVLHDIGKLVYMKIFPDHYQALKDLTRREGCLFSQAERRLGMPASSHFGSLLCGHWRLPDKIREACERHTLDDLRGAEGVPPLTEAQRLICLGSLLTVMVTEQPSDEVRGEIRDATTTALVCPPEEFDRTLESVSGLGRDVQEFMGQFR